MYWKASQAVENPLEVNIFNYITESTLADQILKWSYKAEGKKAGVYMHGGAVSVAALLYIKPLMSSLLQAKEIQHCT